MLRMTFSLTAPFKPASSRLARLLIKTSAQSGTASTLFEAQVADWHEGCRSLTDWEDEHLLDHPTPQRLAEHARMLDELERVGTWMSRVSAGPDFPDRRTAKLVALTLRDLKDARALWHGDMPTERRREILRAVFNEP